MSESGNPTDAVASKIRSKKRKKRADKKSKKKLDSTERRKFKNSRSRGRNKKWQDDEHHRSEPQPNISTEIPYYDEHRPTDYSINFNNSSEVVDYGMVDALSRLEHECYVLRNENETLKYALYNMRVLTSDVEDNRPKVEIVFRNDNVARQYSAEIQYFLTDILSRDLTATVEQNSMCKDEMFTIDLGTRNQDHFNDRIPVYETNASDILGDQATHQSATRTTWKKCFNCSGNHGISECQEAIDYKRVAQRKSEHHAATIQSNRYHIQEKAFNSFKPGVISNELREALELQPSQIPPYIYRMRVLGYPPGWLEEATAKNDSLILYDKVQSGDDFLASKSKEDSTCEAVNYDPNKLIDFPGFNIPLSPDFIDESLELGYPPFQQSQLRSSMESSLLLKTNGHTGKKNKLQSPNFSNAVKRPRLDDEDDMDVDSISDDAVCIVGKGATDFAPPLPPDDCITAVPLPPPPPESPPALSEYPEEEPCSTTENLSTSSLFVNNEDNEFNSRDSPSLTELEETKKLLMMELHCTAADSCGSQENITEQEVSFNVVNNEKQDSCNTSLAVSLGSPRLPTFSSCKKLPDHKKFSEGILGHLHFENLPDSTGTFEKMKGLIQKVRSKLNS